MSPQDDGERARGGARREHSLALQAKLVEIGWRAATATFKRRVSVRKSLYADCRDWCHFAPNSDQGKKACRARGDAPDDTASWQQVGGTGRREPARWGVDHSPAGSGARTRRTIVPRPGMPN